MTRSWTRGSVLLCLALACRSDAPDAAALADSGAAALARGDNVAAIAAFDRAIALDSGLASAYRSRGVAYRNLKQYDRALRDYDTAIRVDSTAPGAYNNRGFTRQLTQAYEPSIRDFDRAIALDSGFTQAYKSRGRSHFYLGDFARAAADFREGMKADTANLYLPIWLHMAEGRLGRADTAALAAQVAGLDLQRWPGPVVNFYLGRISAGQFAASAANADSAVQVDQRCAVAFYFGEYLLWQPAARAAEAKSSLEEAAATCPRDFSEYLGARSELDRMERAEPALTPR